MAENNCIFREAFKKKEIKSVDFFHISTPSPKVWKISRNFAVKMGQKRAKMRNKRQKTPFFHTYLKLWI